VHLTGSEDWRGKVTIDGLHPGMQYECRRCFASERFSADPTDRIQMDEVSFPPDGTVSLNFTTFPDPQLARSTGSHFRFVHAS
jgi:hypothetical protein